MWWGLSPMIVVRQKTRSARGFSISRWHPCLLTRLIPDAAYQYGRRVFFPVRNTGLSSLMYDSRNDRAQGGKDIVTITDKEVVR